MIADFASVHDERLQWRTMICIFEQIGQMQSPIGPEGVTGDVQNAQRFIPPKSPGKMFDATSSHMRLFQMQFSQIVIILVRKKYYPLCIYYFNNIQNLLFYIQGVTKKVYSWTTLIESFAILAIGEVKT